MSEPQWKAGPPPKDEYLYVVSNGRTRWSTLGINNTEVNNVIAHYGPIPDYEPPKPPVVRRFAWVDSSGREQRGCWFSQFNDTSRVGPFCSGTCDDARLSLWVRDGERLNGFRWLDDAEGNQLPRGDA